MTASAPWVQILVGDEGAQAAYGLGGQAVSPVAPHGGVDAIFAAGVEIAPFEALMHRRWGYNAGVLYEEHIDREQQYMETVYACCCPMGLAGGLPGQALALRCIQRAGSQALQLSLVARVRAGSEATARRQALEFWELLQIAFPHDYRLHPAESWPAFSRAAGWDCITACCQLGDLAEIRRFDGLLVEGDQQAYLPGHWQWTTLANEQVWRALAGSSRTLFYNVLLQPVGLLDEDWLGLVALRESAAQLAAGAQVEMIRTRAAWAEKTLADRLADLRTPFLVQVTLGSPGGVSAEVLGAVGTAFTHRDARPAGLPGWQTDGPAGGAAEWQNALQRLDLHMGALPPAYPRLGYLMNLQEANVAYRWPFPPDGGIPGVQFGG